MLTISLRDALRMAQRQGREYLSAEEEYILTAINLLIEQHRWGPRLFNDTTVGTTIANLGMTDVTFPNPLFHGDTVRVETTVISVRDSKSKSDRGIVEMEHQAFNQHDKLVARCVRQAMMRKRPSQ